MSVEAAQLRLSQIAQDAGGNFVTTAGKATLHSIFPNDFEFYMMAFEVVTGSGSKGAAFKIEDRFIFPVLPSQITINKQKILNIKKTAAGIASYQNNSFEPIQISISGTFGRRMRLLLGNINGDKSIGKVSSAGGGAASAEFFTGVKTGYGALKELERIYEKSSEVEQSTGLPYRIHFYNLAFNQAYIVEMNSLSVTQNEGKSAIWYYTLNMTAVAPASSAGFEYEQVKFASLGVANNTISTLTGDARTLIKSIT